MTGEINRRAEWLEADGLGGFASGTLGGIRSRRYHALLLVATSPPTGRVVLVNGFEAWVTTPAGTYALSSHRYTPGITHPDGSSRIQAFESQPWPRWTYRLEDGTRIEQEILVPQGSPAVAVTWRLKGRKRGVSLEVRPLLSGRDYHALHHQNNAFRFEAEVAGELVRWAPYEGIPDIIASSNGQYTHQPNWYRNFLYEDEQARGLDFSEDLACPGSFRWNLSKGEAVWILASERHPKGTPEKLITDFRKTEERRRRKLSTPLRCAADSYIVKGEKGGTIVAGYPWFTDWGRDTFIALRGLSLATGRFEEARDILLAWAGAVSEGMLPNRFPDRGEEPEYNSVDASLWYVTAVRDFFTAMERNKAGLSTWRRSKARRTLSLAVESILSGYMSGTRYGIRCDSDGLLAAGEPGVQLTWMDAKVGDWVVTPRIGKPVEVQALWLNALQFGAGLSKKWQEPFYRGLESFRSRFWYEEGGYLYDVVDVDHRAGTADATIRPNQIFAAGGLPTVLLDEEKARSVIETVEKHLLTPVGLRSLAPNEPGYCPHYIGGVYERDRAYHQGTVWPWLMGPFVEAWVRSQGSTARAKNEARKRFLEPFLRHLDPLKQGHLPEIADGNEPHQRRGCPFQAWSVGEALRIELQVLVTSKAIASKRRVRKTPRRK